MEKSTPTGRHGDEGRGKTSLQQAKRTARCGSSQEVLVSRKVVALNYLAGGLVSQCFHDGTSYVEVTARYVVRQLGPRAEASAAARCRLQAGVVAYLST